MARRVAGSAFILGAILCLPGASTRAQEARQPSNPTTRNPSDAASGPAISPADLQRLFERLDRDNSGAITLDEVPESLQVRLRPLFERLETDAISRADLERLTTRRREPAPPVPPAAPPRGIRGPAIFRVLDENSDGRISREELSRAAGKFDELDEDQNGGITPDELFALPGGDVGSARLPRSSPRNQPAPSLRGQDSADSPASDSPSGTPGEPANRVLTGRLFTRYDQDGDGRLSREEAPATLRQHFDRFDEDGDGQITRGEFKAIVDSVRQSRTVDAESDQVNGRPAPPPAPLAGAAPRRAAD